MQPIPLDQIFLVDFVIGCIFCQKLEICDHLFFSGILQINLRRGVKRIMCSGLLENHTINWMRVKLKGKSFPKLANTVVFWRHCLSYLDKWIVYNVCRMRKRWRFWQRVEKRERVVFFPCMLLFVTKTASCIHFKVCRATKI